MKKTWGLLAAAALALAACGGQDADDAGSGGNGNGGNASADESGPITIAALWEVSGESDVAVDDFQRGAEIAVAALNEAGGIDGREVVLERFAASPLDPASTATAVQKALDAEPSAMVGPLVAGQIQATSAAIERGGVPVIPIGNADPTVIAGGDSASDHVWFVNSYIPALVDAGVDHLTEDLGLTEIGVMGTDEPFGQTGVEQAIASLDEAGLEPVGGEQLYAPDATDLTQQVLAVERAEAVVNWGFPNPIAVQLNQLVQNDIAIPTLTGPSAPVVVDNGLAEGEAIDDLLAVMTCNPGVDESDASTAFVEAYEAEHGATPSSNAALAHDAVLIAAAAISDAGSSDPAAVQEAMADVEVTDGACAESYAADEAHVLNHQIQIVAYAADGSSTTEKVVEGEPVARADG